MLKALLQIGATIIQAIFSPARKRAKFEEEKRRIQHEVRSGDKDAVNRRINKNLPLILLLAALGGCAGCRNTKPPNVVYVPVDRECTPMEYNGVKGWFIPNVVWEEHQILVEYHRTFCNP